MPAVGAKSTMRKIVPFGRGGIADLGVGAVFASLVMSTAFRRGIQSRVGSARQLRAAAVTPAAVHQHTSLCRRRHGR
jgi:hypothetical protein